MYGNVCDIEEIQRIAYKYGLKVIYDAAHTFGERYKDKGIGDFGDASCFSFHATKVFNTIEGGATCYKDKELGEKIYNLKNFGIRGDERIESVGANAKMNEFQAAMGICNLKHIDEEIRKRKCIVEQYRNKLENIDGLQLNLIQENVESNYSYFPVIFDENKLGFTRDQMQKWLAEEGIYARKYFYPITNVFDCFRDLYETENTPIALHISKRVLTLPLYADLEIENVNKICMIILDRIKQYRL